MTTSQLPYPIFALSTGLVLLLGTIVFGWVLVPCFIQTKVSEVKLVRGSDIFDKWSNVPIPVYFKVYLFNVTNPEDIAKGGAPKFNEVGPYVYREKREKIDIRETSYGTIVYKEKVTYFFEEGKSAGLRESDTLTILNVPYVAMALKISELPYPLSHLGSVYIGKFKQKLFVRKNVGEILFKGWYLPMIAEVEEYTGQEIMPNSTFGLFYGKNATDDGYIEVDAGLNGTATFGKILSWRGKPRLEWWKEGSHCNELKGTDGSMFSPFVSKKSTLYIFNSDLCRALFMTFDHEIEFLGISAYRFTAPKEMLEGPRTSESNRCFCAEEDVNNCLYSGVMSMSPCRQGAPIAMSTPHFLNGYQEYITKSGLSPDPEKHETRVDVEPTTGLVLRGSKKIQVNLEMKPVASVHSLSKLPDMLFPIAWADETAEIDDELASELKSQFLTPLKILNFSIWTALGISIGLIVLAFGWCFFLRARSNGKMLQADSDSSSSMLKSETESGSNKSSKEPLNKMFPPLLT